MLSALVCPLTSSLFYFIYLFICICTSQAFKLPTKSVSSPSLLLTVTACSIFHEDILAPLMNKSQIIFSQTQSHTTARAAIWQCAAGLKGVKHTVVLIGNIVYPPIKFSKRQPRLSSTRVTLWFGKHSHDCLAGVNLLLTAVTLFAHVIYFTLFCFFHDKTNYNFSFFIFSYLTGIAMDLASL